MATMTITRPAGSVNKSSTSSSIQSKSSIPLHPVIPPLSQPPQYDASGKYIEQYRLPFDLPTIRAAIPAHCFVFSTSTAIYYYCKDMLILTALVLLRNYLISLDHFYLSLIVRPAYWMFCGFFMWCLFVVGHDCGHGTFSPYYAVNSLFGHLSHAVILVPFHGWQASHRLHHLHHNDVDHDHTWKPATQEDYESWRTHKFTTNPFSAITYLLRFSVLNLFLYPLYLVMDNPMTSGNHFNPFNNRLFQSTKEKLEAALSTTCIIVWLSFLFYNYSFLTLIDCYFVPYFIFVAWLDIVTYLHHTSPYVTYFRGKEWNYLKGGLSTVDRSYGKWIDHLHHNIGTHIVHHLFFTKIPHYHLLEATEGVRKLIGDWMVTDERHFLSAYWENIQKCRWVDNAGSVLIYKNGEEEQQQSGKKEN